MSLFIFKFSLVFLDITTRREAQKAFEESKKRLTIVLHRAHDVIWSVSWLQLEAYYVRSSSFRVFRRKAENFIANPHLFFSIIYPDNSKTL